MPPKEGLSPEEQKRREIANQKHLTNTRLCNFELGIQGQQVAPVEPIAHTLTT